MRRRLFTLLSALSLLLCVGVCALWVRSWIVADVLKLANKHCDTYVIILASRGGFEIYAVSAERFRPGCSLAHKVPDANDHDWDYAPDTIGRDWHFAGFIYRSGSVWIPEWQLVVPLWAVAIPSAWLLIRWWCCSRRYAGDGICPACGYDLRATPDRCPECGTVPLSSKR
jgi:hypothetical protein